IGKRAGMGKEAAPVDAGSFRKRKKMGLQWGATMGWRGSAPCKGGDTREIAVNVGERSPTNVLVYSSPDRTICFFSSRRRHTRFKCDWSSDLCSSDLLHSFPIRDSSVTGVQTCALPI